MKFCAPPFKRSRPALGTLLTVTLQSVSWDAGVRASQDVFAEAQRLEKIFSVFDTSSEISQVNVQRITPFSPLSGELAHVLRWGQQLEMKSGGAFKLMPQCPHGLGSCYDISERFITRHGSCIFDLGGIAKGYIVDCLFEKLFDLLGDGENYSVNAGGDLRTSAEEAVEIRIPSSVGDARFAISLPAGSLATSSRVGFFSDVGLAGARYSPDHSLCASATVAARTCMAADAFTKVALGGAPSRNFLDKFGVQALWRFDSEGGLLEHQL